ncbi:unnamed protein product [Knipowitschia caucasica]
MGNVSVVEERIVYRTVEGPAPPLLDQPWRGIDWNNKKKLLEEINRYTPKHGEKHLRVLVYGPVGAGKSSFINSAASALYERIYIGAEAHTTDASSRSHTLKYTTHNIFKDGGYSDEPYPFVFNDVMGMEGGDRLGMHPDDIVMVLKGHVKEGYKFNPMSPLTDKDHGYNKNPTINDKVHVLVLMLSADCSDIDPTIIDKMEKIRQTAHDLGIPQIAIGTHVDTLCPEIHKDLQNIYRSKLLYTKIKEFSKAVGLVENCIMGVKNYSHETDTDDNVSTLILLALRNMINYGNDYIRAHAKSLK